jgi:hypothetical protein
MRTYKELQDATLAWMADQNDQGLMRQLVKDAIDGNHSQILKEARYDFMLWPRTETLSLTAGATSFVLHARFEHPLFFYNPDKDLYLEEIAPRDIEQSGVDWQDGSITEQDRFMLTTTSKVLAQPTTAATVTVDTTGGTEAAVNSVIITGVTSAGDYVSETLSSDNPWSSLTSTNTFAVIEDITKMGSSWSRAITVTCNSQTILSLQASEYGKQYRVFEALGAPTSAQSILYRFYKKPRALVNDNDIPDLPESYDDILVLRALLAMQGYSRATQDEMTNWRNRLGLLEQNLKMNYQQTRSVAGRASYVKFIDRG